MNLKRIFLHELMPHWRVRSFFPRSSLKTIEEAVTASEALHQGQVCVAVEGALPLHALWKNQLPRERALEVFSMLRVWDTEHNSGVLIYFLLADRSVQILADRGINARVEPNTWNAICREIEKFFRQGQYEAGVLQGIKAITAELQTHFPAGNEPVANELPNEVTVL